MRPGWGIRTLHNPPPAALVAVGAMAGASVRWAISELAVAVGLSLSIAILALNVAGSAFVGWLSGRGYRDRRLWPLAAVGFGGGLTTFSNFVLDIALRLDGGEVTSSAGLATTTVVLALLAALVARRRATKSLTHPHR